MKEMKKVLLIIIAILFAFTAACTKDDEEKKEDGIYLQSESQIIKNLGNNYSFKISYEGEGGDYESEYIKAEEGFYYYYNSENESYAYLYIELTDELFYGDKEKLEKVENSNLNSMGNAFNDLVFFADTRVEKEGEATVLDRKCIKYNVVDESTYKYTCYIDDETGACLRCVAKAKNSYFEWSVTEFEIGSASLEKYLQLAS